MNSLNKGVSIIICCYNSEFLIPNTLKHITDLKIPNSLSCELILVNNNCSDNTVSVAIKEWDRYNTKIDLKVIDEPVPGLIHARKKGVANCKYEIVVFCDDDNWLSSDYIMLITDAMDKYPKIGAVGGQGIAISSEEIPNWFYNEQSSYACGRQWDKTGFCSERTYLWGAGLTLRKRILEKVFETPFKLAGRSSNILLAGDDNELCMRILLMNYELYYMDNLTYRHFIHPKRLNKEYLNKMRIGFYNSFDVLNEYRLEVIKMKNPGVQRFWFYLKDMFFIILIKFKILKPLKRPLLNILKIKFFKSQLN